MFTSTNVGPEHTSLYRYRFDSGYRPTGDYYTVKPTERTVDGNKNVHAYRISFHPWPSASPRTIFGFLRAVREDELHIQNKNRIILSVSRVIS